MAAAVVSLSITQLLASSKVEVVATMAILVCSTDRNSHLVSVLKSRCVDHGEICSTAKPSSDSIGCIIRAGHTTLYFVDQRSFKYLKLKQEYNLSLIGHATKLLYRVYRAKSH